MILLFRFYSKNNKINFNEIIDKSRHVKYIRYNYDKAKQFKVSHEIYKQNNLYDKYILIENICYKRSYNNPLINYDGQIAIKLDTRDLNKRYNNFYDLYYIFYNFEDFYSFIIKNKAKIIIRNLTGKHKEIKDISILTIIETWFNYSKDNIILLKIKFNNKDKTEFTIY